MGMIHNKIKKNASDNVQNEKVLSWFDYPVFVLLTISGLSTILYFFYYWFSLSDLFFYPLCYTILTLILAIIIINNQGKWFLLILMKKPRPMEIKSDWKVAVVTSFVPSAESFEMLEETVKALVALDSSHDTWVLDEGDSDRVKKICASFGAKHFSRKNLPQYQTEKGTFKCNSKHGNYNAWLGSIGFNQYDIIVAFDPDHIPSRNFLSKVLGYFEDPTVGYVQAPQAYYNQKASFIARGAAEETYAYYSSVQMASYGMGYPIIVGSHNTHRATALKQVGGFAPHDADDLLITLLYQDRGWKGVYVPEILARGLTPVDWYSYFTQQRRWARSVLDLKFRYYPKIAGHLSFKTRLMSFLHGLNYLHQSILIFIGLLMLIYILLMGINPDAFSFSTIMNLAILCGVLQICEFYRQRFYLDWKHEWGSHWRAGLLHLAKWPYMLMAIYEAVLNRNIPYQLTTKLKKKSGDIKLILPHLLVIVTICIFSYVNLSSHKNIHPTIYLFTLIILIGSLIPILTNFLNFPEPFDRNLL